MAERKAKNVRWNPAEIKGEANLFIYDPGVSRWVLKKTGLNDGAMVVTFPPKFRGERNAIVVGSEGGLANIRITVQ